MLELIGFLTVCYLAYEFFDAKNKASEPHIDSCPCAECNPDN